MAEVGSACLFVGLLCALYAVGASIYGARSGRRQFVVSARRAFYCLAGLLVLAFGLLQVAYVRTDLTFQLVAQNSSEETPTFYKLTAVWSSQAGSLLLWVLVLSIFASAVLFATRRAHREIAPYAQAVLGAVAAFFLVLLVAYESPFDTFATAPAEGQGLNPLLRHPAMAIHPPMVYTGYVGFAIPFAFMVGALITRHTGADWIRVTRRFALTAWTFLGFGILLGALWSYTELGWGGYWAWDAVENASLLPWLTGTAFLHSIMVQERRGMLRIWNVSLIAGTFVLALLGTFLVRSGILDSIHAFGASTLGRPFLFFIATVLLGSVILIVSRVPDLRSRSQLDSLVSREAIFLLNNLVLVGLAFVVFWGTYFPLISEAVTGTEQSVGPEWFNRYTMPLAIVLVLLTGIGPVLAWRRVTVSALRRAFAAPVAVAVLTLVVLLALTPAAESVSSLVMFVFVSFVLAVVVQEFWRGAGARRAMMSESWPRALARLVQRNRRRYGGYLVHAGMATLFLGIAASSAFVEQRDSRLMPGESVKVGDYTLTYREPTSRVRDDPAGTGAELSLGAVVDVRKGDERFTLRPQRNYYGARGGNPDEPIRGFFDGEATSEVDVRWGVRRDVWAAVQPDLGALEERMREADRRFASVDSDLQGVLVLDIVRRYIESAPPAQFRTLVSPLVTWIWIGGGIVVVGALTALWPTPAARRRRVQSAYAARLGRELSRA